MNKSEKQKHLEIFFKCVGKPVRIWLQNGQQGRGFFEGLHDNMPKFKIKNLILKGNEELLEEKFYHFNEISNVTIINPRNINEILIQKRNKINKTNNIIENSEFEKLIDCKEEIKEIEVNSKLNLKEQKNIKNIISENISIEIESITHQTEIIEERENCKINIIKEDNCKNININKASPKSNTYDKNEQSTSKSRKTKTLSQ